MSNDMTSIQAKEERKKNWSKMAMAVQHKGVLKRARCTINPFKIICTVLIGPLILYCIIKILYYANIIQRNS